MHACTKVMLWQLCLTQCKLAQQKGGNAYYWYTLKMSLKFLFSFPGCLRLEPCGKRIKRMSLIEYNNSNTEYFSLHNI